MWNVVPRTPLLGERRKNITQLLLLETPTFQGRARSDSNCRRGCSQRRRQVSLMSVEFRLCKKCRREDAFSRVEPIAQQNSQGWRRVGGKVVFGVVSKDSMVQ